MTSWHVYMIRCGKGTLYTGITTDVERRFAEHRSSGPRAARYLKGRGPLRLVFSAEAGDRAAALRLERGIKRLKKAEKELLARNPASLRQIITALVS
ncbi:MAG: GIY-YIG nuclease family protein [Deltaproteobacteria bacterium]|nr:GIY-YIG nuclease family protein [Deltaproteobacteria bacterium]